MGSSIDRGMATNKQTETSDDGFQPGYIEKRTNSETRLGKERKVPRAGGAEDP